jgi:hypothetical protein
VLRRDGVPDLPLLVLHPAEPRIALAPGAIRRAGESVEGPEDEKAGTEIRISYVEPCDESTLICEYPEPPDYPAPSPTPGDYMTYFRVSENDGFLGGTMEMEFRSILGGPASPVCAYDVIAYTGVHENRDYYVNLLLTPASHLSNCFRLRRVIQVWEMDGGSFSLNQNDFFGERYNAADFQYPQEIFYNLPMPFYSGGAHRANATIQARY